MTFLDNHFGQQSLDTALSEYQAASLTAGQRVEALLGVTVSSSGSVATTLQELRNQIAPRLRHRDTDVGVISTPAFCAEVDIFTDSQAAGARFALRSAIRLAHSLGFTPHAEIALGQMAVAALRDADSEMSHLAHRLAEADHVERIRAASTLGRPVRVHRNFVVRCAVLGLGEALNAEHDPQVSTSIAIETWLAEQRAARHQRR
ncbi:hypothetical protein [Mycobacterium sp. C31M]